MAFDLDSISQGKKVRPPRIIMLGVEKIGKSTWAAGSPSPIFIPVKREEGIDGIDVPQFPVASSLRDVLSCCSTLLASTHSFETIVIDSISTLEPLIWDEVCSKGNVESIEKYDGGYGKGYTESLNLWRGLTDWLDELRDKRNMASILVGHVKVKRFDDPTGASYDRYSLDINDRATSVLFRWADAILFANNKVTVKIDDTGFGRKKGKGKDITNGQRFLYTQGRPAHPGGGRGVYGQLPYELPLSWMDYQNAIASVV